ncbi:MAG TPA: DUF374 domain-containing protein [Candidatus Binatia bacterium]|nr:DUF374 domain-containing protein [Candidatus Binatia bacterium]
MTATAPHGAAARDAARARDSPFRRHWTWRDRLVVGLAGWLIATALRLVYLTLRVQLVDPHDVMGAHGRGDRVVWATWHDGIVLLPLMVVRVSRALRPRVALSWHRDAEIAAQAVRRFGVAVTRGSAARGWVGAVRGLLEANARGEDLVVVPDGPRGPRHEAKEGVVQLARATRLPVVAIGIAAAPSRRLRSWDRLQVPKPFARVALVLGAPIPIGRDGAAGALVAVQRALETTAAEATALVERAPA